jgi:hypothetical protein
MCAQRSISVRDRFAAAVVVGSFLTCMATAGVLHVPDDCATIGEAIAIAQDGDMVLVADGVYTGPGNRNLNFGGRDLIVCSANGPENCIIDCEELGRAFTLENGETRDAVIEGFTIRNGAAPMGSGGAIDIALETSPTIRNCVIRDCMADAFGGGVAVRGQCTPLIDRCTFIDNRAFGYEEGAEGGGLSLFFMCPATVTNCVFIGNLSIWGGGMCCAFSDATIVNCLFVENNAYFGGGGLACDVANPHLINCTIADNTASYGGGVAGVSSILESYPVIDNSILWNDGPNEIEVLAGYATVSYSDVQGGWSGPGNIDDAPEFAGSTLTSDVIEEYQLTSHSPCIDAGDNTAVPDGIEFDLLGNLRFAGNPPIVDMGAFEFQVETCPGDFDGDGAINTFDLLHLLECWGSSCGDVDGDDDTDVGDLLALFDAWGACP